MRGGSFLLIIILSAAIFMGCEPKPQPINLGGDQCAYCRMMITEQEFGSQILNYQGRAYKFDSVECMAAYDIAQGDENIHSKWVPDFLNREVWLDAETTFYLHSETLRSPMGLYLSAYSSHQSAEEMKNEYGGEIIEYNRVKEIVHAEWLQNDNNHMQN